MIMKYPGWTAFPLLILFSTGCCMPDGDLCRWMNGRKYYIDVGESGIISAENVTNQGSLSPATKSSNYSNNNPQIPQRCSVELITCPSCHFRVTVIRMNISTCSMDGSCRCDFVWVKEAAYSKSGQEFCGQSNGTTNLHFESITKLVSVDFLYTGSYVDAFALQFSAIKNVYVYKGGYEYYHPNSTGTLTSPNFPGGYPSDYSAEYILQNIDTTGFVQLLFTDFQLSLWSYMEILDSNGSRIDVYNGNTFRPPALISSGPVMTVKFQANEEYPSSGFRAIYTFVSYAEKYWINRPSTDCGGFVEDYGGAITMMNMVPGNLMRAFDCIWLVRPQNAVVPGMQISVRVAQFEEMGSKSTLTIRKGLYSESTIVESITPFQQHKLRRGQEYVVLANVGFYIRLIGYFNNRSHVAIIYSTFRYEGCYAIGDLECENGRCIKNALRCDGFNHCGDGSDEAACYGANQGTPIPEDANWWRTLTPNYYFPKSESGPSTGTNTLILVTSLAGLGMFVLTTIVILVKLHKQRQDDSISREILQTISADIEAENAQYNQVSPSDPPMYDPPPTYDEVIKYYLPPPPEYSSINRGHNISSQTGQLGTDAEENPPNARVVGRRSRVSTQRTSTVIETPEPAILRVSLPAEESTNRNSASDEMIQTTSIGVNSSHIAGASVSNTTVQSSRTGSKHNNLLSEAPILSIPQSSPPEVENPKTLAICKASPVKTVKRYRFMRPITNSLNCECRGACSCSLSKENSNASIMKDGVDTRTRRPSLLESSLCIAKSADKNRGSTLSRHLHTIKPSRSKSFANENLSKPKPVQVISKSAGPSSPTERYPNVSTIRVSHRRSSSGPSEMLSTADKNSLSKDGNTDSTDSSLSQMKNLATAFIAGSFGFRSNSAEGNSEDHLGNKSDKNILPSGWGALWNPGKRKIDRDEPLKSKTDACPGQKSDRQPLLRRGSSKIQTENSPQRQDPKKEQNTQHT